MKLIWKNTTDLWTGIRDYLPCIPVASGLEKPACFTKEGAIKILQIAIGLALSLLGGIAALDLFDRFFGKKTVGEVSNIDIDACEHVLVNDVDDNDDGTGTKNAGTTSRINEKSGGESDIDNATSTDNIGQTNCTATKVQVKRTTKNYRIEREIKGYALTSSHSG